MHTINTSMVRGRSYENFSTQKFIIRKFNNTKIFQSTVYSSFYTHTGSTIIVAVNLQSFLLENFLLKKCDRDCRRLCVAPPSDSAPLITRACAVSSGAGSETRSLYVVSLFNQSTMKSVSPTILAITYNKPCASCVPPIQH